MEASVLIPVGLTILINGLGFAVMWGKINEKVETLSKSATTQVSDTHDIEKEVQHLKEDNGRMSVALWGIDGQNGLRGNIKDLTKQVEGLRTDMQEIRNGQRDSDNRQGRIEEKLTEIFDKLDT